MTKLEPLAGGYYLWLYLPSLPAAIIFAILFAVTTGAHAWRNFKTRIWFCIAFTIGGFFETIGYITRASAYSRTNKIMPYAIQNVFILLGPALFAASIYMTLGRIIRTIRAEHLSLVPMRWLTKLFVTGDVLSFVVQGGGGGLMATGNNQRLGEAMVVGGLFIQVIFFGLFIVTTVLFQRRVARRPTEDATTTALPWRQSLYMLYEVSALIMIRSIFRVIEYIMGRDGYLLRHEWALYIFDALLMWIVMVLFFVRYPHGLRPASQTRKMELIESQDNVRN